MSKQFAKLCSMILTLVMLFHMLPHQILADMISTEEMEIPSGGITTETEELDASALTVVEEVTDKRTEFSKEFKMSNGLHMATVYNSAVHYEKNGTWEEIDNTLVATVSGTDSVYTNTAGVWDITFPAQLSSNNWISVTKDGYTLRFGMAGQLTNNGAVVASEGAAVLSAAGQIGTEAFEIQAAQTTVAQVQQIDTDALRAEAEHPEIVADKLTSRLQYTNVYSNTNVVYDLQSNTLKESVVIGRYNSDLRGYRYTLDVGTMVPVLNEDNSIWFYDSNQENVIMVMPAPFMLDAANAYNGDVDVALYGSGSTYTLLYMLPQEWLAAEDRAWPVVLDPVINANILPTNVRDVIVAENAVIDYLHPSNSCGYGQNWGIHRFYFRYEALPELTSADVIVSAFITMNKPVTHQNSDPVEVHKVLETWTSQGLTWDTRPDYDTTIEDFVMSGPSGTYVWDVTDIVRGWYAGQNTGMMFKSSDAIEQAGVHNFEEFWSSDIDFVNVPALTVYFRNNNGLESYWDYTTSSAGRAGTGYVNNYTGNLVWVHGDIGFGGNRMPVSISHVYNANDSQNNNFGLGYGWRTNFNQRVYQWTEDSNYYVWEDADGTKHYFLATGDGSYKDEDGLELTLTTTGSSTQKYCIADKYGNTSYFDTEGRLTKQMNNQATVSTIQISYTTSSGNLISSIIDGANRVYNFSYTDGLLSRIKYRGTGTTEISFVSFGYTDSKLTSITNADDGTVSYGYSGNLLTTATDIDGYMLQYGYSAPVNTWQPYRVLSILESVPSGDGSTDDRTEGGMITIQYDHNQTTFTDHAGRKQIMQFNNWGNTIAIQDGEGHAQYAQYATDTNPSGGKGNQLSMASKIQNTVSNMLSDNSFELGTTWSVINSSVTQAISTSEAYYGSKSLAMTCATTGTAAGVQQYNSAASGMTYTFSAYVKTGTGSAYLALYDGTTTVTSEILEPNSDWTRLQVSYTNTAANSKSLYVRLMTEDAGTVYMDCFQLEKAPTASRYNLIINGDFGHANAWSSTSGRIGKTSAAPQLNYIVYKLSGTYNTTNRISQTVQVSGSEGDTFVLAGWAMGDAAPLIRFEGSTYDSINREFAIIGVFNNTDGTTQEVKARFNPDVKNWQYSSTVMVAQKNYSSITVYLAYDHNANDVYFDGIQLFKEEFGNSYTYDENGNVTRVTDLQKQATDYVYEDNDLTKIIQNDKAKMTYVYDDWHNVIKATSATGVVYEFTYDVWGNNTSVSIVYNGVEITSSAKYSDDGNRLESTTDALGKTTTYSYNADTNVLEWVEYPEDTAETRTQYNYDDLYRLKTAITAVDSGYSLAVEYDYTNDLLTRITTNSTVYTFEYGLFAQSAAVKVGSRTLASYEYTDNQNRYLQKMTYHNGVADDTVDENDFIQYNYDTQGRLILETYEDGDTVAYTYDNNGALATVTDSATGRKTTYYYDFTDRLMKYTESGTNFYHSVGYEYDSLNNLTSLIEIINGVEHSTTYTYDDDNRVSEIDNDATTITYTYDEYGRVTKKEMGIYSYEYTYATNGDGAPTGQISGHRFYKNGSSQTWSYTYTYDDNGNILTARDMAWGIAYEYDSANQLVYEHNPWASRIWEWTYDDAGNITSRKEYARTNGEKGELLDTVVYTYGDTEWGDLLTAYDGVALTYDGIGNLTDDGTWDYVWEHGRQLASMTDGTTTWSYTYDANGMRTSRTNGTTTYNYIYNGSQLVQMTVGTDTLYFTYDASGLPATVTLNGTVYYYVVNMQGDVVAIYTETGTDVCSYVYDAWGKLVYYYDNTSYTIDNLNPLRYRGYVYDSDTGLYYLQSRYYNPEWGRFINADGYTSTGQGILGNNMFAYCGNNPLIRIDYTGESFSVILGFNFNIFGWGALFSLNLVSTKENFGMQYSYYISDDTDITKHDNQTIGVDIGPYIGVQITEEKAMEDLEGQTQATGGDLLFGLDFLSSEQGEYIGWQWGASAFSANMHALYTNTETLFSIPTIDLFDIVVDWVFGG